MDPGADFFTRFEMFFQEKQTTYPELNGSKLAACMSKKSPTHPATVNRWLNKDQEGPPKAEKIKILEGCYGFTKEDVEALLIAAGHLKRSAKEITTLPMLPNLDRYLREVSRKENLVDFSLFQGGQERDFSDHALDEIYVPLRLGGRAPWADRPDTPKHQTKDLQTTRLLAPKNRLSRHLALLGDAGSGKTTILRHLVGALAKAKLDNSPSFAGEQTGLARELLVPLLVRLGHYAYFCRSDGKRSISRSSFYDFLPIYAKEIYDVDLEVDFFRKLLASGCCLLALDGFDEVPDEVDRHKVVTVARDLVTDPDIGRNIIILSSRVAAYRGPTQLGGRFQTLWVQPLNRDERRMQIERWVAAIGPKTERSLDAEDILKRMPEESELDRLAKTPMIVTTLCVLYFYSRRKIHIQRFT